MRKYLKFSLVTFVAFTAGMFTHAKLHAKPQAIQVENKEERIVKIGKASWYSKRSPGIKRRTANNEIFDDKALTCAMWDAPFNQRIRVTNRQNGQSVVCRVNDRGPHKRLVNRGRIIDLTRNAFRQIGGLKEGLIEVEIEFL